MRNATRIPLGIVPNGDHMIPRLLGILFCFAILEGAAAPRAKAQTASTCSQSDSAAEIAIRKRLADWVTATNGGNRTVARDVWAPGVVGWFPRAAVFGDSAAFAAAGIPFDRAAPAPASFELRVDQVDVGGRMAAVHDIWVETRHLPGDRTVRREIRGSELWRCMPDGRWRIARYVSAPELWNTVR